MLLILIVRVVALVSHWVVIFAMQTAMVVRAVVYMVVSIVVMAVVAILGLMMIAMVIITDFHIVVAIMMQRRPLIVA